MNPGSLCLLASSFQRNPFGAVQREAPQDWYRRSRARRVSGIPLPRKAGGQASFAFEAQQQASKSFDGRRPLSKVKTSTLIIRARRDRIVSASDAAELRKGPGQLAGRHAGRASHSGDGARKGARRGDLLVLERGVSHDLGVELVSSSQYRALLRGTVVRASGQAENHNFAHVVWLPQRASAIPVGRADERKRRTPNACPSRHVASAERIRDRRDGAIQADESYWFKALQQIQVSATSCEIILW
jgi:hypothetical protein